MSNICPYPGLRPFTEEESIYFKGRDTHILQIIAQLEKKKFLMLTGASGDGKSSLVYAGVIPNARAGFFKAKFNNWVVVDFRPERNPLSQLANSISKHLEIENEKTQKELSYGFSSLINLYKSSRFFVDLESEEYKIADEKEKKSIKRKGANLLILADQFEEFFTNPENYSKGVPSKESQIVVNLLIETAKIALEQSLPIYIVCTMRSDYIGQCASFRGLPEMIGFSQFFVPRLKRKEIHQVIEDPALLSGNKISNRLIETLINEMSEGFDQLPVLQHTLNNLWHAADKGNEQMDLVHLAMIAGINPSTLPKDDKQRVDDWLQTKPEFYKQFYIKCSLEQSLSANADILFEMAHEYYNKTGIWKDENKNRETTTISKEDAQLIIKTAFTCLTKIDVGRAVRNRMTLQEITEILNNERLNTEIVGNVLNLFREQGATFISPFINDNPESKNLKPETVLDITHESFIRNWGRLKDWANVEYENLNTFLDFNKQLQRWLTNNKSHGYLLPIGPLTYFENWMTIAKPNKYWFARYDETELSKEEKLIKAEQLVKDAELFITKSALKLFFTRTVLKYGAGKIASLFGIVALIILCSYYTYDYHQKQNPQVIERLEDRGIELLKSKKVDEGNKAHFIINYERLHPKSFAGLLNNLHNDDNAFDIALSSFIMIDNFADADSNNLNPLAYPLLNYMSGRIDNLINQQLVKKKGVDDVNLERLNKLVRTCVKIKTVYSKDTIAKKYINKYVWVLNNAVNSRIDLPVDSLAQSSMHLNQAIQLVALLKDNDKLIDIDKLLNKISPFENDESKKRFKKLFPKKIISKQDVKEIDLNYNGGFHLMAELYATKGNKKNVRICLDSLDNNNLNYLGLFDVYSFEIISGSFNLSEFSNSIRENKKKSNENLDLIKVFINNLYMIKLKSPNLEIQNYYSSIPGVASRDMNNTVSLAPYLISNSMLNNLMDKRWDIQKKTLKENDELKYMQALYFKQKASFAGEVMKNIVVANDFYKQAFESYNNISTSYFSEKNAIWLYSDDGSGVTWGKKEYFFNTYEATPNFHYPYKSDDDQSLSFVKYMLENNLLKYFKDYYVDMQTVLKNYIIQQKLNPSNTKSTQKLDYSFFDYAKLLNKNNSTGKDILNKEFLDLVFINKAFEENDSTKAYNIIERMDMKKVLLPSFSDSKSNRYLIKQLVVNLAVNNRYDQSIKIVNALDAGFKRNILIDIVEALHEKGPVENTPLYLDEFFKTSKELQTHYGVKIYNDLAMIGTKYTYDLAENNLKDVGSLSKSRAQLNFIRGIIYNNNYYLATQKIPEQISSSREAMWNNEIIEHYIHSKTITSIEDIVTHKIVKVTNNKGWESYDTNFESSYGADYESIFGEDFKIDTSD